VNTSSKLLCAAVVVVASVGASWFVFSQSELPPPSTPVPVVQTSEKPVEVKPAEFIPAPKPVATNSVPNAVPKLAVNPDGSIPSGASALKYKVPQDRSLDMQLFDKAILYLMDVQEDDGHFDSKKTGAAPEFQTLNNDIILTSISAWVLLGSSSGVNQNVEAVARARKAVKWLESKTKPDGTIGDVNGPGESAMAQMFASDTFRLAVTYSMRDSLRQATSRMNSVALRRMSAKNGGFGPIAKCDEPSTEMLALSAFVFKFAGYDGFKFDSLTETPDEPKSTASKIDVWVGKEGPAKSGEKKPDSKAAFPIEDEILGAIRAGFKRLDAKTDPSGAVFCEKVGGPADWRATVGGMQGMFLINPSRSSVNPALAFVFGPFDKATESYPRILENVSWGKSGEGYDAMSLWQGSIAVIYMFTEDKYESKTWVGNLRTMLKEHQGPDGSWPVAGMDAKRGRVWRAGLHAMTMALTAPPPPPPAPPPDDQTINTPAVK